MYTVLLITSDKSGSVLSMLQSSYSPQIPRIIITSTSGALKDAWEEKNDGSIFYDRICTFLPCNQELHEIKNSLGIVDGFYYKEKAT